jgi:hypothetical protein
MGSNYHYKMKLTLVDSFLLKFIFVKSTELLLTESSDKFSAEASINS